MRFVRLLVVREARVAVDAEERSFGVGLQVRRDLVERSGEIVYELQAGLADKRLVLVLVF